MLHVFIQIADISAITGLVIGAYWEFTESEIGCGPVFYVPALLIFIICAYFWETIGVAWWVVTIAVIEIIVCFWISSSVAMFLKPIRRKRRG